MPRAEWSRAVDSLKDAYGKLERSYEGDVLLVPHDVRLEGDRLLWSLPGSAKKRPSLRDRARVDAARAFWRAKPVPPGADLLRDFASLGEAPTADILSFAQKWGVLGVCRHGKPSAHSLECMPLHTGGEGREKWDRLTGWEPVSAWRRYARRARTLLLVAAGLRERPPREFTAEELRPLGFDLAKAVLAAGRYGRPKADGRRASRPTVRLPLDLWQAVADAVNEWLALGDVRPRLMFSERFSERRATGGLRPLRLLLAPQWRVLEPEFPLFGVLGMRLAYAVSAARGWAVCSECGRPFEPGRVLRRTARHFCPDCGRRAMVRAAVRDYRARRAGEG